MAGQRGLILRANPQRRDVGQDRDRIFRAIEAGDVLFAVANDGLPKILLVYEVGRDSIFTRLVTSQTKVELGRDGRSITVENGDYACKVVSAAPLPPEQYSVVLGLDRKMRLMHSLDQIRLSEDEKKLLVEIEEFYKSRPIPDG